MQEYYFANYRLLVDDEISEHESMQYLSAFRNEMPYTHTFTAHMGEETLLDKKYEEVLKQGAERARAVANVTLKRVQKAVGLLGK